MYIQYCKNCNKVFGLNKQDKRVKYCEECTKHPYKKKPKPVKRTCLFCYKIFVPISKVHTFCSILCKNKYHSEIYYKEHKQLHKQCPFCLKYFRTYKKTKTYCSNECYKSAKYKRDRKRLDVKK